jgi:molybdenum cofactor cytidylyltransferase
MSTSIRAASVAVMSDAKIGGLLILLLDQWQIRPDDLRRLVDAWTDTDRGVAAARYAGTIGVPALFGREYFRSSHR